jgi:hypothetical protein
MKYIFFLGVIIATFYVSAMQLLFNQVNNLSGFYSNIEEIAQQSVTQNSHDATDINFK